jgi:hypothetical protein
MEGMVTDLQLAREKQQNFEAWQKEHSKQLPIDMSVQVLTTGFWPQYKVLAKPPPHIYLPMFLCHSLQLKQIPFVTLR